MSSRFVSGGTLPGDQSTSTATSTSPPSQPIASTSSTNPEKASAWAAAQVQLDRERQQREAARQTTIESSSQQSLYDTLQANKAAKQAAFEEANRIKNQFRALDDDEVDFLDDIVERERREEEVKRREVEEGLAAFKAKRRNGGLEHEGSLGGDDGVDEVVSEVVGWGAGGAKKRKREKEQGKIKGLKRRASEGVKKETNGTIKGVSASAAKDEQSQAGVRKPAENKEAPVDVDVVPKAAGQNLKMGLVDYGSDDDD
ncbi:N-terminal domain of NEFA-interacting nuclear protein NIP30-domain-containing protein [Xylariales sp. AK1849]|nr:N-terminal domain of NEFA-interacting nuclear protein NIP30-domain-containing protein [Xylariales sp. AK1849]